MPGFPAAEPPPDSKDVARKEIVSSITRLIDTGYHLFRGHVLQENPKTDQTFCSCARLTGYYRNITAKDCISKDMLMAYLALHDKMGNNNCKLKKNHKQSRLSLIWHPSTLPVIDSDSSSTGAYEPKLYSAYSFYYSTLELTS